VPGQVLVPGLEQVPERVLVQAPERVLERVLVQAPERVSAPVQWRRLACMPVARTRRF
jgi:hypothetical protein